MTASTFGSSVTILKVTDVTGVTDVIAGSLVGGRSEYGRVVTHGHAGVNESDMGVYVEQLTAQVQVDPCDFRPLNLSFIHISDLPKR